MKLTKKNWRELEKRVADLEKKVQDQPLKLLVPYMDTKQCG